MDSARIIGSLGKSIIAAALMTLAGIGLSGTEAPVLLPEEEPGTPEDWQIVWSTEPGSTYAVEQSDNVSDWTTLEGYPQPAQSVVSVEPVESGQGTFFRVTKVDQQGPEILEQFPAVDDFAIPLNASISLELTDETGVNWESYTISHSQLGSFSFGDNEIVLQDGVLTFDAGNGLAHGLNGETITVSIEVADVLGNVTGLVWRFELESEAIVANEVFVFGSPQAEAQGQEIEFVPATREIRQEFYREELKKLSAHASSWSIHTVEEDRLILEYWSDTAPEFPVGGLLANVAPTNFDEIFYRKVTSISDDSSNKLFTLMTEDVLLTEFIQSGSLTVDENTPEIILTEEASDGLAARFETSTVLPTIEYALPAGTKLSLGDISMEVKEFYGTIFRTLKLKMDFEDWGPRRIRMVQNQALDSAMVFKTEIGLVEVDKDEVQLWPGKGVILKRYYRFLGFVGLVPVWIELQFEPKLTASSKTRASFSFDAGIRAAFQTSVGYDFNRNREDWWKWIMDSQVVNIEPVFIAERKNLKVESSMSFKLDPGVNVLLDSLVGVRLSPLIAEAGFKVSIAANDPPIVGKGELSLGGALQPTGLGLNWIKPKPELSLKYWDNVKQFFPDPNALEFVEHPQDQNVNEGDGIRLTCAVNNDDGVAFQWYFNGMPLPGKTLHYLHLFHSTLYQAGSYTVRATKGQETVESDPAYVSVNRPFSTAYRHLTCLEVIDVEPSTPGKIAITNYAFNLGCDGSRGRRSNLRVSYWSDEVKVSPGMIIKNLGANPAHDRLAGFNYSYIGGYVYEISATGICP